MSIEADRIDQTIYHVSFLVFGSRHRERKIVFNLVELWYSGKHPVAHCFQQRNCLHRTRCTQCFAQHGFDGGHRQFLSLAVKAGNYSLSLVLISAPAAIGRSAQAVNLVRQQEGIAHRVSDRGRDGLNCLDAVLPA